MTHTHTHSSSLTRSNPPVKLWPSSVWRTSTGLWDEPSPSPMLLLPESGDNTWWETLKSVKLEAAKYRSGPTVCGKTLATDSPLIESPHTLARFFKSTMYFLFEELWPSVLIPRPSRRARRRRRVRERRRERERPIWPREERQIKR